MGTDTYYLYAINPNGILKWKYKTGWYSSFSPAISSDGTIYVASDGLYALNPNGALKWMYKTGDKIYSSPAIGSDGTIYVGSRDGYLYAINPDGTLKWKYQTGGEIYSSPAIASDGTIYVGSDDDYLYAIGGTPPIIPPNQRFTLYNGYVSPSSGDASTTFSYYVTYSDPERDVPTVKYVYIDGSPYTMAKISGDYVSGAVFKYSTTLSAGSHNYYFYFEDSVHGHTVRLPTSGTYSGPNVSPLPTDFSITSSSTSLTIQQGSSATSTITITSINGFNQPVQLTISGAPSGVTATLNPQQVTPPADGSTTSTLTVSVGTATTPGSYTLTVTGNSGAIAYSTYITLEITAAPPPKEILSFTLSPGWQTKELFVPICYRSREEPGTFVLGAHDRRDMWYLVKVYKRQAGQTWMEIIPDEFLKGTGLYLSPWSEKTFLYTAKIDEEIKIEVWNDLNDDTLTALWTLDFATRALLGVSISSHVTDPEEFKVKLATFYSEVLTAVGYMRTGHWRKAALELGNILATSTKAREALVNVLKDVGIQVTAEAIKALLIPFRYIKNILSTGAWDLIDNANKEPFMEEVIFAAKEKVPLATPDVRVTKGLTIIQKEAYYVGQTITAQFTITNRGTVPISFNIVTAGGRGPKGEVDVRDFTFKTDTTLNAGDSYNYQGELKLLDNGTYHFFIAYQTPDGKWETSVPAEAGTTNTVDIFVNPIPEQWLAAELGSPAELRVYDSQGRITGLINSVEKMEIPHSICYGNIVVILAPADSYKYDLAGTSEGSYSLMIINGTAQEIATFNATDIPMSANAIHRYTIDWVALSQGGDGVTVKVDSNGDGTFEQTLTADSELTHDEFMLQTATTISHVVINEFEQNPPSGGHHFVELFNPTSQSWDIGNCIIYTTHGDIESYTIPAGTVLPARGFWQVTFPGHFMDNEDSLVLLNAQGQRVDETPSLSDTAGDSRSWQRHPDGSTNWAFAPSTTGIINVPEYPFPAILAVILITTTLLLSRRRGKWPTRA